MENEYMKRGYLLPEGCKDLIDVLKPQLQVHNAGAPDLPPVAGELSIQEHLTVAELAAMLQQKPFRIIADLMEIGVFANVHQELDFETIAQVTRRYGYVARRAV